MLWLGWVPSNVYRFPFPFPSRKPALMNSPFRQTVLSGRGSLTTQVNVREDTSGLLSSFPPLFLPWMEIWSCNLLTITHSDDKQEADSNEISFRSCLLPLPRRCAFCHPDLLKWLCKQHWLAPLPGGRPSRPGDGSQGTKSPLLSFQGEYHLASDKKYSFFTQARALPPGEGARSKQDMICLSQGTTKSWCCHEPFLLPPLSCAHVWVTTMFNLCGSPPWPQLIGLEQRTPDLTGQSHTLLWIWK